MGVAELDHMTDRHHHMRVELRSLGADLVLAWIKLGLTCGWLRLTRGKHGLTQVDLEMTWDPWVDLGLTCG